MWDFLVVGAGLFGAVCARQLSDMGKRVLVIDRRGHIAGNAYTETVEGIHVHRYGAHIFHTSDREVWDYVCRFAEFNRYTNSPLAKYKDELYNLPFNMNTFHALWGVASPEEARQEIERQVLKVKESGIQKPRNLEEQALLLVGRDIYEKLVKGYTEKQWGRRADELPAFIIRRLPVRFTYDNNYFNDLYQGIPIGGYTAMIGRMFEGVEVRLGVDYLKHRSDPDLQAGCVIFTGMIDEYFDYCLGELEYRGLRFETEVVGLKNFQGNAVVNYTEYEVPYTRIIEHRHFEPENKEASDTSTVITREYPSAFQKGEEPYYPVNDERNDRLYQQYSELAQKETGTVFGGRLGQYRYFDMDDTVRSALDLISSIR
ncbi:MAG: UDP-galactopyranose mutase [Lachnospiraceae bacterium]|nr:UDP-galactopyranose mutase [Lachnospiraceae bacterium]